MSARKRVTCIGRLGEFWAVWLVVAVAVGAEEHTPPQYDTDVAPLLTKYCTGCHNVQDREGGLSLESYGDLQAGLEQGPVVLAGQAASSRLIRVLVGLSEPEMPPEDNAAPTDEEIARLRAWVDAGAKGPDGVSPDLRQLVTPHIETVADELQTPITALALSPDDRQLALARFAQLVLLESVVYAPTCSLEGLPGKIHAVDFTSNGEQFVIATGIAGLYGEAQIYDADSGSKIRSLLAHRDILYDAEFSPDGRIVATGSYDQTIILWNGETGEQLYTLKGHHGAIFDLAFSPDGKVLASASGDETVKLWHVATGKRLDTLGQPEAEQYCVAFSPDGRYIVAGGADRRIRVWEFLAHDVPRINPLVISCFAHEGSILRLAFTPDSGALVSTSDDRTIKIWETEAFAESVILESQSGVVNDLCISSTGEKLVVGRLDGSWDIYPVRRPELPQPAGRTTATPSVIASETGELTIVESVESEPNDSPGEAQQLAVPSRVQGVIYATRDGQQRDVDLFRFAARTGEQWIFDINAARNESQLDSKVEILTSDGNRIERLLLQAVRDSYLTFSGSSSDQVDGLRLHNWEEMELNEYLYVGGEVMKLWHYPRGPDSGFMLYPGYGKRFSYFNTTALSHALHEPAYIVQPYPPGTRLVPTGLPIFTLYYENDDDSLRKLDKDSSLTFVAPAEGDYLVRVSDVCGFGGESYHYELIVHQPQPDFEVTVGLDDATIHAGGGREFSVVVDRKDGFDGDIRLDIDGLPPGYYASTPIVVQGGQLRAYGTINALASAPQPTADNAAASRMTASAVIAGRQVSKTLAGLGELKLGDPLPARIKVVVATADDAAKPADDLDETDGPPPLLELVIAPGETISALVRLDRKSDFSDEVRLGGQDAGRNLPHGVYVDNIGLSGLLVNEGSDQREFFITAAKWVPETIRLFHLRADISGQQSSWPVLLHVRHANTQVASPSSE